MGRTVIVYDILQVNCANPMDPKRKYTFSNIDGATSWISILEWGS